MLSGEKWYWFVWIDQWLSLLCSDIGLFILAGESIKVNRQHINMHSSLPALGTTHMAL